MLAKIQSKAAYRSLLIFSCKIFSGPVKRATPKTPIEKPNHFFWVITSFKIILARNKTNRGIDERYIATSLDGSDSNA